MYEQIDSFLDSAFSGVQMTDWTFALKSQLRSETITRYERFLAEGKDAQTAFSLAVAGIGDLNDRLNANHCSSEPSAAEYGRRADPKRSGILLAVAVMLYILCPIPVIILGGTRFAVLSVCLLLGIVAIATGIIIYRAQTMPNRNTNSASKNNTANDDSRFTPVQRAAIGLLGPLTLAVYLIISFTTHDWYITWLIFPIFGVLGGVIRLCFDLVNQNTQSHEKSSNSTAAAIKIVALLVVGAILISTLALSPRLAGYSSWNDIVSHFTEKAGIYYENEEEYATGIGKVDAEGITDITVNWPNGTVNVTSGDGDEILLSEAGSTGGSSSMRCLVGTKKIVIQPCKSGERLSANKDLSIVLPKALDGIKIDTVSANISLNGITVTDLSIDGVSGNTAIMNCAIESLELDSVSGCTELTGVCPERIDSDTVSGDVTLTLADCTGFTLSMDTVTSKIYSEFEYTDNDDVLIYGDGKCILSFSGVSGDVNVKEALN